MKRFVAALPLALLPLTFVLAADPPASDPPATDPPVVDPTPVPTPPPTPLPKKPKVSVKSVGGGGSVIEGGNGEKVLGPLGKGLSFSGGWSLTHRANSVSGSTQARSWYDYQNNNSFLNTRPLGPFQQNLDLHVQGKLLNVFDVNATLTNDKFRASQQQFVGLNFEDGKGTKLSLGDVNATLSGNELVSFSRNLQGLLVSREFGKGASGGKLTGVASITRALTRRGNFQGNGTTGPYFVNAQQIMQGSETILLNGQKLVSGQDYKLDYFTGQLDMLSSRILNRQDTVEYTYEAQSFNTQAGVLTGLRYDLPQTGKTTMGVTLLNQKAGAGGVRGAAKLVTQYFPVVGDINYRYFLDSPPQGGKPTAVRYQNRLLTENVDYVYNASLNYLQLRVALPPDTSITGISSLAADYTPTTQAGVGGDRRVFGFDAQTALPGNGRVNLQLGQSDGVDKTRSGMGITLATTFQSPANSKRTWTLTNTLRNIEPGFSSIDSTSSAFLRAERTLATSFAYNPGKLWNATVRLSQGKQGSSGLASTGATPAGGLTWAGDRSLNLGVDITPESKSGRPLPQFTLRHDDRGQTYTGSRSSYLSDTLGFRWTPKKDGALSFDGSLGRTASRGRSVFATAYTDTVGTGATTGSGTLLGGYRNGASGTTTDSASNLANLGVRYALNARLSVNGSLGLSKTSYLSGGTDTTSGNGTTQRDLGMGLRYQITPALLVEWTGSEGANGQSVAGYYAAAGGVGGTGTSTGQKTRNQNATVRFSPTEKLDLSLSHRRQLSLIPGYDSTENVSTDLSATANISPTFVLGAQVAQTNNTYVSGGGKSDNLSYGITTQHGPFGKLTFNTSLSRYSYGAGLGSLGTGTGTGTGVGAGIGGGLGGGTSSFGASDGITNALGVRANYDLPGASLFLLYSNTNQSPSGSATGTGNSLSGSTYHSSSNFLDNDFQLGAQWKLTELVGMTFSTRLANRKDREDAQYSYRARTFNVDFGLRF